MENTLKEKYPNWLYITPVADKVLTYIREMQGEPTREMHVRIWDKYIDKHFPTWDAFCTCMNGDFYYPPVILCVYAESIGIKPNHPIRVMRQIIESLENEINLQQ